MSEKPILFKGDLVRAIFAGAKTQTRRIVNLDTLRVSPTIHVRCMGMILDYRGAQVLPNKTYRATLNPNGAVAAITKNAEGREVTLGLKPGDFNFVCPYIEGDTVHRKGVPWEILPTDLNLLWVRECFGQRVHLGRVFYRADDENLLPAWKPSIHMPKAYCRLRLAVHRASLGRLQDMSKEDAMAEGIGHMYGYKGEGVCADALVRFRELWDGINGAPGKRWDDNPWVWTVYFSKL